MSGFSKLPDIFNFALAAAVVVVALHIFTAATTTAVVTAKDITVRKEKNQNDYDDNPYPRAIVIVIAEQTHNYYLLLTYTMPQGDKRLPLCHNRLGENIIAVPVARHIQHNFRHTNAMYNRHPAIFRSGDGRVKGIWVMRLNVVSYMLVLVAEAQLIKRTFAVYGAVYSRNRGGS